MAQGNQQGQPPQVIGYGWQVEQIGQPQLQQQFPDQAPMPGLVIAPIQQQNHQNAPIVQPPQLQPPIPQAPAQPIPIGLIPAPPLQPAQPAAPIFSPASVTNEKSVDEPPPPPGSMVWIVPARQFETPDVRRGFIAKVITIVALMLLVTAGMSAWFMLDGSARAFVARNPYLLWLAFGFYFVSVLTITCCSEVTKTSPCDIISLVILTLALSFLCAVTCSQYKASFVLQALVICIACCVFCAAIACCQNSVDFTRCTGCMCIFMLYIIVVGIVGVIASRVYGVTWVYTLYSGLASLFFMLYLIIDLQMIIGNKHITLQPDQYVYAAAQIYIDIVLLFLHLLQLLQGIGMNNRVQQDTNP